ncbi:MAG: RluA family pseudouridine synthase [Clostridia bacterium]|nr:RluA family pseudouridine synthase [Clostridia bacterium]
MIKHIVQKKEENKNIERILLANYNIDKNTLYKAFRKRDIKINGKRVSNNIVLKEGDIVEAYVNIKTTKVYDVVFENDYVLIINKKQGISVFDNAKKENSLIDIINSDFNSNYELCHRIDRNTGGLIIISKDINYTDLLKNAINNRVFKKIYKCIVWGNAEKLLGLHKAWHFKDSEKNIVYIYKDKKKYCKEISTEVVTASYNKENNTTELEINLLTGRTHQIRAHLAFLGHFIIGDGKYGVNEVNRLFGYKYQMLWASRLIPDNLSALPKEMLPEKEISVEPKYE